MKNKIIEILEREIDCDREYYIHGVNEAADELAQLMCDMYISIVNEGVEHLALVGDYLNAYPALKKRGFTDEQIEKALNKLK